MYQSRKPGLVRFNPSPRIPLPKHAFVFNDGLAYSRDMGTGQRELASNTPASRLTLVGNAKRRMTTAGPVWSTQADGDYLRMKDAIQLSSDWAGLTLFAHFTPRSYIGTNPGFMRSGTSSTGTTFLICGSTGVWARLAGNTIGGPTSGTRPPVGVPGSIAASYENGRQEVWSNASRTVIATHAVNIPSDTIWNFGFQFATDQAILADWHVIYVFDRYLERKQHELLHNNPYMFLSPRQRVISSRFVFVSVGGRPDTLPLLGVG